MNTAVVHFLLSLLVVVGASGATPPFFNPTSTTEQRGLAWMELADINGDGVLDVVYATAQFNQGPRTLAFRLGSVQGGVYVFGARVMSDIPVGTTDKGLRVDLDESGDDEIVLPGPGARVVDFVDGGLVEVAVGGDSLIDIKQHYLFDVDGDGERELYGNNFTAPRTLYRVPVQKDFSVLAPVAVDGGSVSLLDWKLVNDLTGDGRADLLDDRASSRGTGFRLFIRPGLADGSFGPEFDAGIDYPGGRSVGAFGDDPCPRLVSVQGDEILAYRYVAPGVMTPDGVVGRYSVFGSFYLSSLEFLDVDGDGLGDVRSGRLVLWGGVGGLLYGHTAYGVSWDLVTGDMNQDGVQDFVSRATVGDRIMLHMLRVDRLPVGAEAIWMQGHQGTDRPPAIGDFDADGDRDFVFNRNGFYSLLMSYPGDADPLDRQVSMIDDPGVSLHGSTRLLSGDVVHGGGDEVVVVGRLPSGMLRAWVYSYSGARGGWMLVSDTPLGATGPSLSGEPSLVDVDDDGALDLVGQHEGLGLFVAIGDGAGGFAVSTPPDTSSFRLIAPVYDYDGDGALDVVRFDETAETFHFDTLMTDGSIVTGLSRSLPGGVGFDSDGSFQIAVGDIDGGAGGLDIVIAYFGPDDLPDAAWLAVGLGSELDLRETFDRPQVNQTWGAPTLADFDNDGDNDLMLYALEPFLHVFENQGGVLASSGSRVHAGGARTDNTSDRGVFAGDLNGDGYMDVVANSERGTFLVLNQSVACPGDMDGNGEVDSTDLAALLAQWGMVGAGDFNGDGVIGSADLAALLAGWGSCP